MIDPVRLNKDINDIPGICPQSKDAIRRIFRNHFDVKFESFLKLGAVYAVCEKGNKASKQVRCSIIKIVDILETHKEWYALAPLEADYTYWGVWESLEKLEQGSLELIFEASSPRIYFTGKK